MHQLFFFMFISFWWKAKFEEYSSLSFKNSQFVQFYLYYKVATLKDLFSCVKTSFLQQNLKKTKNKNK